MSCTPANRIRTGALPLRNRDAKHILEATMRMFWAAAAAMLLVGGVARADKQSHLPGNAETAIGVGIMCNTLEQAERYVSLVAGGQQPVPAIVTVNTEVKDPRACGVATIAFKRDETVDTKSVRGKQIEIVRIIVIAGFNGTGWQPVTGMVQYAVMEPKGIAI